MLDSDALTRHYSEFSDEALRDVLGAGPDAYQPAAWAVVTRVAASRGLRYLGPPRATARATSKADANAPPGLPLVDRVASGIALAVLVLLALNAYRGWHWFGDAGTRAFMGVVGVFSLVLHWREPRWEACIRAHEEHRRGSRYVEASDPPPATRTE